MLSQNLGKVGVHLFADADGRAMEILCKKVDSDRIIWGSDFGFGAADSIEYRLGLINKADIGKSLRHAILGENPLRLINLDQNKIKNKLGPTK